MILIGFIVVARSAASSLTLRSHLSWEHLKGICTTPVLFPRGLDHLHRHRPLRRRIPHRQDVDDRFARKTPAAAQGTKAYVDPVWYFSTGVCVQIARKNGWI